MEYGQVLMHLRFCSLHTKKNINNSVVYKDAYDGPGMTHTTMRITMSTAMMPYSLHT